jgi:hypothetical protein
MTGSTLPPGAERRAGRCSAPVHHGNRAATVVAVRLSVGSSASGPVGDMCAECLADFAVGADELGPGLGVEVRDASGAWRPVKARPVGRPDWPGPSRRHRRPPR